MLRRPIKTVLLAFVAAAGLCGCVQPYEIKATFYDTDFERFAQQGNNTIVGQAFMRQRGGRVVTAAGRNVTLMPLNSYTIELGAAIENNSYLTGWANLDPRLQRFLRKTTADASGNFEFKDVPDGQWIVLTVVTWSTGRHRYPDQGGPIVKTISVYGGATEKIIMYR